MVDYVNGSMCRTPIYIIDLVNFWPPPPGGPQNKFGFKCAFLLTQTVKKCHVFIPTSVTAADRSAMRKLRSKMATINTNRMWVKSRAIPSTSETYMVKLVTK